MNVTARAWDVHWIDPRRVTAEVTSATARGGWGAVSFSKRQPRNRDSQQGAGARPLGSRTRNAYLTLEAGEDDNERRGTMQLDDQFEPEDGEQSETPVAFVSTQEPVNLRVSRVEDDRMPEGMICMGTFFDDRLIARSAVTPEALAELTDRNVFQTPVRLALAAVEEEPGLQCRLFALLPLEQLQAAQEDPDEPWAASVPRYEDAVEEPEDEDAVASILLGHIVRFEKDRKHASDLAAEAADVLRTILSDDHPLTDVVDKLLDDLLGDA